MKKKLFYLLFGFIILTFLFSSTVSIPIFTQEKEKEEETHDISLEDLINVEITTAGKKAKKVKNIPTRSGKFR